MNQSAKIKHEILKQLKYGACCRVHLHRVCCRKFGLKEPALNRTEDSRFDNPFNELVGSGFIRKIRIKTIHIDDKTMQFDDAKRIEQIGNYAFYELTQKRKRATKP